MLVLQLVQEGKLKLNDPVSGLLPDYRKDTGARMTVHHLLNHTSGLPNYTDIPGFMTRLARVPVTEEEMVARYCSGDLQFEPGSQYRTSNSGYFLLGAIIGKVTGNLEGPRLGNKWRKPGTGSIDGRLWNRRLPRRSSPYGGLTGRQWRHSPSPVVKDHTGPGVSPQRLRATICQ